MTTAANRLGRIPAGLAVLLAMALAWTEKANATVGEPEQICDRAAQVAAQKTGVPLTVLQAITRTETGRKRNGRFSPWPWTVNMEGKGVWFDTPDEARAYVFRHFKSGARSFDIGCFQINYKWHHRAFSSIDEMFDPLANATYAAEFLKGLYTETGNWSDAAGAYHSRTPKYADRYKAVFERHRRDVPGTSVLQGQTVLATAPAEAASVRPRVNNYPLLQPGGGAILGSLAPIAHRRAAGGFLNLARPVPALLVGG